MSYDFAMNVSTDNRTGDVLAVYFRVRRGKAAEVKEFEHGNVFANYDADGRLLGIEMLAPSKLTVLDSVASTEPEAQRFINRTIPREMAAT